MKKLTKFVANNFLPLLSSLLPLSAFAQQKAPTTVVSLSGFVGLICSAVNWIFTFLIILAVLFVLIAAFKYLTAAGDPEKVKGASHQLMYAVIAVAIAVLAKGVPFIVGGFFGASGFKGC